MRSGRQAHVYQEPMAPQRCAGEHGLPQPHESRYLKASQSVDRALYPGRSDHVTRPLTEGQHATPRRNLEACELGLTSLEALCAFNGPAIRSSSGRELPYHIAYASATMSYSTQPQNRCAFPLIFPK